MNNKNLPNPDYVSVPYEISFMFMVKTHPSRKRNRHWMRQQRKKWTILPPEIIDINNLWNGDTCLNNENKNF